ncbi:interferon alpha/beta receptor 2 isoform X2 [Pleuronectes platessa]|uniref:interferon alpha/beta receptor 2 isoform X2 n=1 Tax=Pleuronectes platessa TaxID=8262 RepID=UPI00232A0A3F|nr:interferon alpha/beta receptor 2 isoform X2 [Pleuronectes platessa]
MGLWTLLLQLHLVFAVSLTPPSDVSISSFNMEHTLNFLPGPGTPSDTHFTVQIVNDRKNMWRPVVGCLELTAGQMCNLTRVFTDPYTHYKARVQAFTTTQTSSWTESGWFQPISDTVLGPPDVSVSGCGNCLILQLKPPATKGLQCNLQLENLYRGVILHVRRTRDGAQFRLNLPFSEEKVIMYLQPGVEYCVSISVTALLKSNHVASKPYCAFTSHPPSSSSLYLVIGLLVFFCILGFLITGLVVNGGQRSFTILRQHLFTSLSYTNTS